MLPTIFGAAVYQINILVGTLLASLLPKAAFRTFTMPTGWFNSPWAFLPRQRRPRYCPAFHDRLPTATMSVWERPSAMP